MLLAIKWEARAKVRQRVYKSLAFVSVRVQEQWTC